jgi:hypothetical protein
VKQLKDLKRYIRLYRGYLRDVINYCLDQKIEMKYVERLKNLRFELFCHYRHLGFDVFDYKHIKWPLNMNLFKIFNCDLDEIEWNDYFSDEHVKIRLKSGLYEKLMSVYDTVVNFLIKHSKLVNNPVIAIKFLSEENRNYDFFDEVKQGLDFELSNNYYSRMMNTFKMKLIKTNFEAFKVHNLLVDYFGGLKRELGACTNLIDFDFSLYDNILVKNVNNSKLSEGEKEGVLDLVFDAKSKYFDFFKMKKDYDKFLKSFNPLSKEFQGMFM